MKCPFCGFSESKVLDSRPIEEGESIRRRRECLSCQKRFTTYETIEKMPLYVIKNDGSRQLFDKQKVLSGMLRACVKRPVPIYKLEEVADKIEQTLQNTMEKEVSSSEIGKMIMKNLKEIDQVAYIRFVSVYRSFEDVQSFFSELNKLKGE